MWAAYKGCTDVAELLLDKGANPNITGQVRRELHENLKYDSDNQNVLINNTFLIKYQTTVAT